MAVGWRIVRATSVVALAAVWCGAWCTGTSAQQLAEMRGHRLDPRDLDTGAVAMVDVDGDGDPDLVVANGTWVGYQTSNLYLNDGLGTFTHAPGALPLQPQPTSCIGAGDLDRDGDVDLVFGNFGYGLPGVQNQVLMNDGRGRFRDETATRMPAWQSVCGSFQFSDATRGVAVVDVDRDGDLDLVFANWCQNRLYLNDGAGNFRDATSSHLPPDSDNSNAVVAGDLDNDGDADLVFGNAGSQTSAQDRVYWNDGAGHFSDATFLVMPLESSETMALALGDVDRDGDLDLVAGNSPPGVGHGGRQNRLYLNDGAGHLTDATSTHLPHLLDYTHALALADFDGDGCLDLIVGNGGAGASADLWFWHNTGTGRFVDASDRLVRVGEHTTALAVGDVDRDGDLDLVVGNLGPERLLLNRHRHVEVLEQPSVASSFTLQFTSSPGYRAYPAVARSFVTAGQRWSDLGPFGWLGLDPALAIELRPTFLGLGDGVGQQVIAVPPLPELSGLRFYVQGLLLPDVRFTNVWAERVR